jgi:hypothetical protein
MEARQEIHSKQPLMVCTFLKVYMELGPLFFVSARTNKRHHHHQEVFVRLVSCEKLHLLAPCNLLMMMSSAHSEVAISPPAGHPEAMHDTPCMPSFTAFSKY